MKTKTIGIALIIIGIVMMIYTGIDYITTKNVANIGSVQINRKENHTIQWSPIVGVVLFIGGIIVVVSGKKTNG